MTDTWEAFAASFEKPSTRVYVCRNGMLLLSDVNRYSAYVWKVAVKLPRMGTATALYRYAFRKHPSIRKWSGWIDSENSVSHAFHASLGFTRGPERDGGNVWILRK